MIGWTESLLARGFIDMARRSNGKGTVRKRKNGLWEGMFYEPTGKRKSVYGRDRLEVVEKIKKANAEMALKQYVPTSMTKVSDWLDMWINDYNVTVSPNTLKAYSDDVRLHISPAIGQIRLTSLTPPQVQKFVNSLIEDKKLAPKTVKDIHGTLHRALTKAVQYGYIKNNPADNCDLPQMVEKEIQIIDEDMARKFLEEAKNDVYYNIFLIDLLTGMREGEILGLTWDCVNFKEKIITVKQQLLREKKPKGIYYLGPLKNKKIRTFKVPSVVIDCLKKEKEKQDNYKSMFGDQCKEPIDNLVFTDFMGNHLSHTTVRKHCKKIFDKIGLPEARFHDLRHTYAAASISYGDDIKMVQHNMGHYSASFTYDTYCHIVERMRLQSADRMEEYNHNLSAQNE